MSTDTKHAPAPIDREACWQVLERAAASPALKRAARLREFLFYVGTKSLKEGRSGVHEQEIGQAVFGRRDSYDTSQDNIVRVSATELRKRIDAYFATEGSDETIVFEIPRGSYVPAFRLRIPELPQPATEAAMPVAAGAPVAGPAPASRWPILLLALVSLVTVGLGFACFSLWQQNQNLTRRLYVWKDQPALAAFWSRFFNSPQQTDVVVADTSFMLIEDMMKQSYSLNDYVNRSYVGHLQTLTGCGDPKVLASIASRSGGSFGDFRVAEHILALGQSAPNLQLEYARDYTADAVKHDNAILIGSRKSNPWVDLFSDELNFDLEYDRDLDQTFVKNLHPRPGEQAIFAQPANPYATLGYGVIAYLPNPSHTGNALIVEGTNSEATNAAGDFLTSEPSMQSFLSKFPGRKIPYFEVLLKTSRVAGTPLQAEIVAYRTY